MVGHDAGHVGHSAVSLEGCAQLRDDLLVLAVNRHNLLHKLMMIMSDACLPLHSLQNLIERDVVGDDRRGVWRHGYHAALSDL
jgi:hypothetical protein